MGIGAAITGIASWLGASAATAATIGTVGSAALAVGGTALAMKKMNQKGPSGGSVAGSTAVMGPQTPGTTQKEEDLTVGSGRDKAKGRRRGTRQLMAPQDSAPSVSQPATAAQGLRV